MAAPKDNIPLRRTTGRRTPARRGQKRSAGRVLAVPFSRFRAFIRPDGTLAAPARGPCMRVAPPGWKSSARIRPEGALPLVEWRETWKRFKARMSAFGSERGAFLRIEVENPYREPRRLELEAVVSGPPSVRGTRLEGGTLRGAGGEALVSFAGADVKLGRVSPRAREVRVGVGLVLPARGVRVLEAVLWPRGRTRASSFGPVLAETLAEWDSLRDSLASAHLPDEALQAGFDRALGALLGSIAPCGSPERFWPRPGDLPARRPPADDAWALRTLDLWGGGRIVEGCLDTAFAYQGQAAPPGEHFVSARGYLSSPTDDELRDRSAADCGAILHAASARADVGAPRGYSRRVKAGIVAACEWIIGALGPEGVLPPARWPGWMGRRRGEEGCQWMDGVTWRGLESAARCLERIGAREAARVRAAVKDYGRSIKRKWGASPGRPPRAPRELAAYSVYDSAREILSGALDAEMESHGAVDLLQHLRQVLLREEEGALRLFPSAPREWFEPGSRLEFERLPTSAGPVSVSSFASPHGDRVVAEVRLPAAARSRAERVELRLGPPVGRALREVRVDGRRSRRFKPRGGTIALSPRGSIEVEALLSTARR